MCRINHNPCFHPITLKSKPHDPAYTPVLLAGSHLELHWLNPPRKILVVAKPSPDVLRSLVKVAEWLLDPQRAMHVYVEPSVYARLGLVSAIAISLCTLLFLGFQFP